MRFLRLFTSVLILFSFCISRGEDPIVQNKDKVLSSWMTGYNSMKEISDTNPSLGWPSSSIAASSYGFPYKACGIYGVLENGLCPDYESTESKPNATTPPPKDCQSVDFRSMLPPVRDQDSLGWCYAFTAADLVSFKLGKEISAVDMAISNEAAKDTYLDELKSLLMGAEKVKSRATSDGGYPTGAISAAKKKGFCLEVNLPARDVKFANIYGDLSQRFKAIQEFKLNYAEFSKNSSETARAYCSQQITAIQASFPILQIQDIEKILSRSSNQTAFEELSDLSCGPRIKNVDIESKQIVMVGLRTADKAPAIDSILDSGRPTGIVYNAGILTDPNSKAYGNVDHVSSIVGRKWNSETKTCEYLLRNSWGETCTRYHFSYQCEKGYVWIPKDTLLREVGAIDYIK